MSGVFGTWLGEPFDAIFGQGLTEEQKKELKQQINSILANFKNNISKFNELFPDGNNPLTSEERKLIMNILESKGNINETSNYVKRIIGFMNEKGQALQPQQQDFLSNVVISGLKEILENVKKTEDLRSQNRQQNKRRY